MMIGAVIAIVILLDQAVKFCIRTNFAAGETLPVIPNVFHITYVQNTGVAFSMFENMPMVTIVLPLLLMIACLFFAVRLHAQGKKPAVFCLGLIIGGGIGNLIDRAIFGYVTDMFDFRVFPVFNVADIAVTAGCALLILWVLFFDREESGQ